MSVNGEGRHTPGLAGLSGSDLPGRLLSLELRLAV